MASINTQLSDAINCTQSLGVRWSVEIATSDGTVGSVEPTLMLHTASVAKVFLLIEVAHQVERGNLNLHDQVQKGTVPPVHGSGLWQHLNEQSLTIHDVCTLVGVASDNWATNALLALVGLPAVQERARQVAPLGSTLLDSVRDIREPHHAPTLSTGCAHDWVLVMQGLANRSPISPGIGEMVMGWLSGSLDLSMVSSVFGLDPLSHGSNTTQSFQIWNKTGTDAGVRADVGFVQGPQCSASFAAIAQWDDDGSNLQDAVLYAMRAVGQVVRECIK